MSFAARHRADEPCEHYFGNLCSGFGADCICMFCGCDLYEHPEQKARVRELFAGLLGDD